MAVNDLTEPYIKVGRLPLRIAKAIKKQSADIYVSRNYLRHIEKRHREELQKVGLSPLNFIKIVCKEFDEIRVGEKDSLLLVVSDPTLVKVAIIVLNLTFGGKKNFWEVKTAGPRRVAAVKNLTLKWAAAKHTANDKGRRPN